MIDKTKLKQLDNLIISGINCALMILVFVLFLFFFQYVWDPITGGIKVAQNDAAGMGMDKAISTILRQFYAFIAAWFAIVVFEKKFFNKKWYWGAIWFLVGIAFFIFFLIMFI